jgi:ketosteroid isomerase-like protein
MPASNVETVRGWYSPFDPVAGADERRDRVAKFWDSDGDYYPARKFPEAQPCHGIEQIAAFLVRYAEAWDRYSFEIRELVEVGDDRVLACATLRGQGRGSGVSLEGDIYFCNWVRHGRLFRVEDHLTLRGALHALGLEGETLQAAGLGGDRVSDDTGQASR